MHANEPEMAANWEKKEKQNEEDESSEEQLEEKKVRVTKSQLKKMISEMLVDDAAMIGREIIGMSDEELLQAYYRDLTAQTDPETVQALEDELYARGLWEGMRRRATPLRESAFSPMRSRAHPEFAKAIKGKLNESIQQAAEDFYTSLDAYVDALDDSMGPGVPTQELKAEVLNFVDGYFEDTEYAASQAEHEEGLATQGFKNPSYG